MEQLALGTWERLKQSPLLRRRCAAVAEAVKDVAEGWEKIRVGEHPSRDWLMLLESTLLNILDVAESLGAQGKGARAKLCNVYESRLLVDVLDENHARLNELLHSYKIHQRPDVIDADVQLAKLQAGLQKEQSKQNSADWAEDCSVLRASLASSISKSDKDLEDLAILLKELDDDSLDQEIRSPQVEQGGVKFLLERIASGSEVDQFVLQANISRSEIEEDENGDFVWEGSFAQAVKGWYKGKAVVLHKVSDRSASSSTSRRLIRRETEQCKHLNHKNIARVIGTSFSMGVFTLVTEFCDSTLSSLLYEFTPEAIQPEAAVVLMRGIVRGLEYLHAQNLVHGNLNPSAIFLSRDLGRVKLSGFELRFSLGDHASSQWRYMAPEVLELPAKWTSKADLFSFGIISWEILHRTLPWGKAGEDRSFLLRKVVKNEERPKFSMTGTSLWQSRLIELCWAADWNNRLTAKEALSILDKRHSARRSSNVVRSLLSFVAKSRESLRRSAIVKRGSQRFSFGNRKKQFLNEDLLSATESLADTGTYAVGLGILLTAIQSPYTAAQRDAEEIQNLRKAAWRAKTAEHILTFLSKEDSAAAPDLIANSLKALGYCMQHDELESCALEIGSKGAVTIVLSQMQMYPNKSAVQEACCFVLSKLAADELNAQILMDGGVAEIFLSFLQLDQSSAFVVASSCAGLRNLAGFGSNASEVINLGSIGYIIAGMEHHSANDEVQIQGCATLANLFLRNIDGEMEMKTSAVKRITAAMVRHYPCALIQEIACGALANLASNIEVGVMMMKMKAPERILSAMDRWSTVPPVQIYACGAISNLAANNDNEKSLMQMGAAERVAMALALYPADATLQHQACGALFNLSFGEGHISHLESLKVRKLAEEALKNHSSNPSVVQRAKQLLSRFSQ